MQFKLFLSFLVAIIFVIKPIDLSAQQVLTNSNGDQIIVFPDGSWRYFDEKDPVDLDIFQRQQSAEVKNHVADPSQDDGGSKLDVDPVINDQELNDQGELKDDFEQKVTRKVKKTKVKKPKVKKPKVKKVKKGKKVYTKKQELDAKRKAIQFAERMAVIEKMKTEEEEEAKVNRINAEEKYEDAINNSSVTENEVDRLNKKIGLMVARERLATRLAKKAKKNTETAQRMVGMNIEKREKQMKKMGFEDEIATVTPVQQTLDNYEEDLNISNEYEEPDLDDLAIDGDEEDSYSKPYNGEDDSPGDTQDSGIVTQRKLRSDSVEDKKKYVPYDRTKDVMVYPPTVPCEYSYNDVDEFTGKRRVDLSPQTFFVYTSDNLKEHFKNRDYLTCEGYLSAVSGGVRQFNLIFTINSEYAKNEFGFLEKGSILTIKFLDGTTLNLQNKKTEVGEVDTAKKQVVYNGLYLISGKDEKKLSKLEVDRVRVVWGTGYEDYEVYEMDFFIDQFKCLNAN